MSSIELLAALALYRMMPDVGDTSNVSTTTSTATTRDTLMCNAALAWVRVTSAIEAHVRAGDATCDEATLANDVRTIALAEQMAPLGEWMIDCMRRQLFESAAPRLFGAFGANGDAATLHERAATLVAAVDAALPYVERFFAVVRRVATWAGSPSSMSMSSLSPTALSDQAPSTPPRASLFVNAAATEHQQQQLLQQQNQQRQYNVASVAFVQHCRVKLTTLQDAAFGGETSQSGAFRDALRAVLRSQLAEFERYCKRVDGNANDADKLDDDDDDDADADADDDDTRYADCDFKRCLQFAPRKRCFVHA